MPPFEVPKNTPAGRRNRGMGPRKPPTKRGMGPRKPPTKKGTTPRGPSTPPGSGGYSGHGGGGSGGGGGGGYGGGEVPYIDPPAYGTLQTNPKFQKFMDQLVKAAMSEMGRKGPLAQSVLTEKQINRGLLKPSKYARDLASAKYGAQDAALARLHGKAGIDAKQAQDDIGMWYGKALSNAQGLGNRYAEASTRHQGDLSAGIQGLMSALGGEADPGNRGIAQAGATALGELAALSQNEQNYASGLAANLTAEQAQQLRNEQRRGQNLQDDLAAQRAGLAGERGSFQAATQAEAMQANADRRAEGQNLRFQQLGAVEDDRVGRLASIQNILMGAGMFPSQMEQAGLSNQAARADIANKLVLNAQERARLQQFAGTQGDKFGALEPGTRAQLSAQLQENLLGPMGYLKVHPNQYLNLMRNRLYNIAGYDRSPTTEAYLKSHLTPNLINWWNKYHPKKRYTP